MKFDHNGRLEHKDPEGDRLTADVYHNDTTPSTGFLVLVVGYGRFSKAVRMDREQARKFAKAIRKEVKRAG